MSEYVFDNAAMETEQRFRGLEACLDPATTRQLEAIGAGPGWHCLEVGGGGGSIARWLARRVGPEGRVLVTDIDPRWMQGSWPDNVDLRCHDVVRDELPVGEFDLIHARLVLIHLPERHSVLSRLVAALKPGGWILLDEFDLAAMPLLAEGEPAAVELFHRVNDALHRVLIDAGVDIGWGHKLYRLFQDEKLVDVTAEGYCAMWSGGSPWAEMTRANIDQLEEKLVGTGMVTAAGLDSFRQVLGDPAFTASSYLMISTRGRRPAD